MVRAQSAPLHTTENVRGRSRRAALSLLHWVGAIFTSLPRGWFLVRFFANYPRAESGHVWAVRPIRPQGRLGSDESQGLIEIGD